MLMGINVSGETQLFFQILIYQSIELFVSTVADEDHLVLNHLYNLNTLLIDQRSSLSEIYEYSEGVVSSCSILFIVLVYQMPSRSQVAQLNAHCFRAKPACFGKNEPQTFH
jgi:hypothetical protein